MGRYISMFFLTVFTGLLLMFLIPLVFGNLVEGDVVLCILFIIFGSFIITQIFYIIELMKKGRK
ncbi:hypothetical protein H9636_05090 [Ureibacillus sp. Re31]|uniref:Uncharacterized protein n=1 Tax=Ureibacillus galli TaxID=2762222 RepID=A0ABR8X9M4_9BACL|nr:hypothetical protein [Ureibacillus galli]MBD8026028.1 hypothetical protein [Ureibacillus galli]